jgi:hypothetical protein
LKKVDILDYGDDFDLEIVPYATEEEIELQEFLEYIDNENYRILVKLNDLLEDKDKDKDILSIEEHMKKIQSKKYITVSEFKDIYNISKTSQQDLRGRLNDSLPYHQKVAGGKIVYVVEEVEKWFENQHK